MTAGPARGQHATRLRAAPALLASAAIVVCVFVANAVYVLGIRSNNPLLYTSGLGSPERGVVKGSYTIDPNEGWTAQALGHLAAQMWRSGQLPLWNQYEGLGQPLAGEMQSAAMFLPFILLQLLPNGIFVMHLALELVAGFSTLLLLRSLRLSWLAAACGGCLFAVNGTFSVMTNAPFNPIAFLPLGLWGIELIVDRVRAGRRPAAGMWVTALALAFMLYSGFPETAYLEGLFIAGWAVWRLAALRGHRLALVGWSLAGAGVGLVMALPILLAFLHFLGFGWTAYHGGSANDWSYQTRQIATLAMPYLPGALGNPVFGLQAGYLTLPAVLLAIVGFAGPRPRGLKIVLGVILAILLTNMFGFPPTKALLRLVPGIASILTYKYGVALIAFAVAVLAAFGIDDMVARRVSRKVTVIACVLGAAYVLGAFNYLASEDLLPFRGWTIGMLAWIVIACAALAVLLLAARPGRPAQWATRGGLVALSATVLLVIDAAAMYAVPQLSASPTSHVNLGPVRYLQANLGTSRFYSIGVIQPNYGSYFQIAQINANDLPVAQKFSTYVTDRLAPRPGTPGAVGTKSYFQPYQLGAFNPDVKLSKVLLTAYGQQQQHFQAAAVKYVVMKRGVSDGGAATRLGLQRVYSDPSVEIWQDPQAAPLFTTARACQIQPESATAVKLDCPQATTLTRRSLSSPGWTVDVSGSTHSLKDDEADRTQFFQTIDVPAGRSEVSFSYLPPFFRVATALALLTVLLMLADGVLHLRRRAVVRGPRQGRPLAR